MLELNFTKDYRFMDKSENKKGPFHQCYLNFCTSNVCHMVSWLLGPCTVYVSHCLHTLYIPMVLSHTGYKILGKPHNEY